LPGFRELKYSAELLKEAGDNAEGSRQAGLYTGCILLALIAVESFINTMLQDLASVPAGAFSVHELGLLTEQQVRFQTDGSQAGNFTLERNRSQFWRLEDKVLFLFAKCSSQPLQRGSNLWQRFNDVKKLRDNLTHPKDTESFVSADDAEMAVHTVTELIEFVGNEMWGKPVKW
jgi:hypothetical protein